MKGLRYISLLLLLTLFVLIGHNLVPHHHHSDIPPITSSQECPLKQDDHHEKGKSPHHCHAFNNVEFEKYSHSGLRMGHVDTSSAEPSHPVYVPESEDSTLNRHLYFIKPGFLSPEIKGLLSLRGPPALS